MVRVILVFLFANAVCFPVLGSAEALPDDGADGLISGTVRVIDGDTLQVGQTRVRLFGIDTLEADQKCGGRGIGVWDCGEWVSGQVDKRYGGREARCTALDVDRYSRVVARCFIGGEDIARALVLDGLAFAYRAYSMDYDLEEKQAAVSGQGLHNVEFALPAAYRTMRRQARVKWSEASADVSPDCRIKGNVSRNTGERIFHVEGQRDYAATIITEARGERWFCSEAAARAAGWRKARR